MSSCKCKTKKGERCKKSPSSGSGFCSLHNNNKCLSIYQDTQDEHKSPKLNVKCSCKTKNGSVANC